MKYCRTFGFIVLLALLLGTGISSGRAENAPEPAEALQRIQTAGELRVGVSLFTPWTMTNTKGELVGFEIDVANQLAKDIGVKPVFTVLDWKEMLPALLQRRIDIVIAGMVITPERALKVNFSNPYASSGIGLATNLQLTKDFTSIKDLNRPAVKVICVAETVSAELAQRLLPNATIQTVKTSQEAIRALTAGEVHAYIASDPLPTYLALEHPEQVDTPLSKPLIATRAAFAVNKGQADFVNFLNAWITAKEADTWLPSAQAYWFDSLDWRPDVVKQ